MEKLFGGIEGGGSVPSSWRQQLAVHPVVRPPVEEEVR